MLKLKQNNSIMKFYKIILASLFVFLSFQSFAQLENENIIGTWEGASSENIFRLKIALYPEGPQAHYEMIRIKNNGDEEVLYTSDRRIWSDDNNYWYPPMVNFGTIGTTALRKGFLADITILSTKRVAQRGCFEFEYISSVPLKARFKVDFCPGLKAPDEFFNIPTDIVMTKVN